jgi:lipoprotein-anchoring transpeptidase ErfK/SrfK
VRLRRAGAIILVGIALASCGRASARRFPKIARGTGVASVSPTPSSPGSPVPVARACARPTLIGTVRIPKATARVAAGPRAKTVATFARVNPQGATQVFDLDETVTGVDGKTWYRALLPMRPNGTKGFIPASALRLTQTSYRIDVNQARFKLTLWNGCRVVGRFPIGFGKIGTPTPIGRFYLISLMRPPVANTVYGPYAFGLSAYSNAITNWRWGGVIGLHGTNDPSSIGKRMSHGCVRMRNRDITRLAKMLPLGTPIRIH